jgi:hypothetical protein
MLSSGSDWHLAAPGIDRDRRTATYGVWVRPITYRGEVRSQALAPEKSARSSHRASGGTAQNTLRRRYRAHWTRSVY